MSTSLPFTVIGGYLGAGKTTLLNHLLTNAEGLRVAALVNDFGSVNIDADLIRSHAGDTINLANGCMCCSLVDGFAVAIGKIRDRKSDFDRIVIEASGVADPGKIAQYGQMYQLPLDGILVVADAEQVRTQAQNKYVGDTVVRQFAQADLVVLNKTDLISAGELASLRSWLAELVPGIPIIETVNSVVPIEVLLGTHKGHAASDMLCDRLPHPNDSHRHEAHPHGFETWTVERSQPLNGQDIARFASGLGKNIYRSKGFVYLENDPTHRYLYQQVGTRWTLEPSTEWGDDLRRTQLVVIGREGATSTKAIEALLQ